MNNPYELIRIRNSHHPAVSTLQDIYEAAFPAKERRHFPELLILLKQPDMYFYAITVANEVVGLCIYWQLKDFYFLEHIAIAPAHQRQGLGKQVMEWLLNLSGRKLVLEVERPLSKVSRNRIRFYQDLLGFTLHDALDYYQPPYQKGNQPVPLYLMTAAPIAEVVELLQIAHQIKQKVYERFYS